MISLDADTAGIQLQSNVPSKSAVTIIVRGLINTAFAATHRSLISMWDSAGPTYQWATYFKSDAAFQPRIFAPPASDQAFAGRDNWSANMLNVPFVWAVKSDGAAIKLFANGVLLGTAAFGPGTGTSNRIGVGFDGITASGARLSVQNIKIFSAALSDNLIGVESGNDDVTDSSALVDVWTNLSSTRLTGTQGKTLTLVGVTSNVTDLTEMGGVTINAGGAGGGYLGLPAGGFRIG